MSRPIFTFGSINMDLVARVPKLPKPGETLTGYSFSTVPGGKGANQAVAVAKLGGSSQMVGRVGDDAFGQELLASLKAAGVQSDRIFIDRSTSSGVAMIAVNDQSENHIIVIAGANGNVDQSDLDRLMLTDSSILLLQLEIPFEIVQTAARSAKAIGATVILDPAPAPAVFPDELYGAIDIITPNATETEQLVGFPIQTQADAERAAEILQQRGTKTVIIKMGAQGVYCATEDDRFFMPVFPVVAIDTVAAGDAFNAGLAVALAEGHPMREAVRWGAASGALSTTKSGAQSSLSDRATLDDFLRKQTKP
ncbi:ribokinase [Leptolyngbya boryana NIES-2135]|jgi:ribokinase|uniref:Ribokinase n=1 Tax=Leptolyngbya boryana NIES-2135 TaxID=1973484 RepID=A0A1Z4JD85_LEPBY|nr:MULTISPECIES: ribokinase [Leptolyngbya]BAY54765.1 ribokinase [Leptolyngbya boryana NIES-2135]MBD2365749.1 ribokinase [Leptolyngbya sp. FACHB-161]MBD2371929.1 ribokinase [Leptolyngbya sp. FACHB-238]MBD2396354.1 ribokinase [Leptolyngbya sp. FACHB-239]MBD2402876.1 ribokinase [Leptolyngbya sp. FACHB-402]